MLLKTDEIIKIKKKCLMVDGCFDPLHEGHIKYFKFASSFHLPVFCNIETDEYITKIKKRPPLLLENQRIQVIDAIRYISYVHLQTSTTADVLKRLLPIKYVKGKDWKEKELPKEELEICQKYNIQITYCDIYESSTRILLKFMKKARNRIDY